MLELPIETRDDPEPQEQVLNFRCQALRDGVIRRRSLHRESAIALPEPRKEQRDVLVAQLENLIRHVLLAGMAHIPFSDHLSEQDDLMTRPAGTHMQR